MDNALVFVPELYPDMLKERLERDSYFHLAAARWLSNTRLIFNIFVLYKTPNLFFFFCATLLF